MAEIGFISTRFAGQDGVSLESAKWAMPPSHPFGECTHEPNKTYVSTLSEPDKKFYGVECFLCSQAVVLAMTGGPAICFQNLTGTINYQEGAEATGRNCTINCRKWQEAELLQVLEDQEGGRVICPFNFTAAEKKVKGRVLDLESVLTEETFPANSIINLQPYQAIWLRQG